MNQMNPVNKKVIDPVCEMEIDPKTASYQTTYQDKTYYFDSRECKDDFEKNPQKYLKKSGMEQQHGMPH